MSDVPLRNIKNNIQHQFIWDRLEKLMPWISGSYIPIKKYRMIQPNFFQKARIWIWGTGWISGCLLVILFSHSDPKAQPWGGLKTDILEAFRPTETGMRGQRPR